MSSQKPENENEAVQPLRLLIADDDANDRDICINLLKKSGLLFRVESAETPEEFARELQKLATDIVVADYRMKGWTGMDALASLKKMPERTVNSAFRKPRRSIRS